MEQKGKIYNKLFAFKEIISLHSIAKLTINISEILDETATIQAKCIKLIPASTKVNTLTIEVTTGGTYRYSQRLPIMCDGSFHNLKFCKLTKKTPYNVTAIWTSEQDHSCNLDSFSTCE